MCGTVSSGRGSRCGSTVCRSVTPGDAKPVGEGVSELRIDYGLGYRVYFVRRGETLIVLLAGDNKRSQARDIKTALTLARSL